jgi:serine/threonine-protein kinase
MNTPDSTPSGQDPMPRFGALAVRLGYTSRERVREGLVLQERMKRVGVPPRRLGDILLAKGYLTDTQQIKVSKEQSTILAFPAIPGYQILSLIGKGAFGFVWKGLQTSMDRIVAIKGLSPERSRHPKSRERFLVEARAVARLNHPHIVQGIDVLQAGGTYFLIMEFIDGPSVGTLIRRHAAFPERKALRIVTQVTSALHHAHSHGIIHRDIKPENIMLTRDGVAKLCDLGVAKVPDVEAGSGAPKPAILGTADYISPEQARGESSVDTRSDIYSLGATLFHMITGRVPFPGESAAAVVSMHLSEPAPPAREVNPSISTGTEAAIRKMMAKRADDRFQTPKDLYRELERIRLALGPTRAQSNSLKPSAGPGQGPKPGWSLRRRRPPQEPPA